MERLLADAEKLTGIHYDIDSFADVVDAIHVVQTEMGITGTTAEEAATTIEGSIGTAKASWENFLVALASPDLDLTEAMEQLMGSVATAASNIIPRVLEVLDSLGEAMFDAVTSGGPQMAESAVTMLLGIIEGVLTSTPQIIAAILLLLALMINEVIVSAAEWAAAGLSSIGELAKGVAEGFAFVLSEIKRGVSDGVSRITSRVGEFLAAGVAVIQGLKDGVVRKFDDVRSWVADIPGRVLSALGDVGSLLWNSGASIINGLWNGLKSKWNSVKSWFSDITSLIPNLKGPAPVDAKLLVESGELIMGGLSKGLSKGWADVAGQLKGYTAGVGSLFSFEGTAYGFPGVAHAGSTTTIAYSFGDVNLNAADMNGMSGIEAFLEMLETA